MTENVQTEINNHDNLTLMGVDSIKFMQLVILIEREFKIVIEDNDLMIENFTTIDKIANYLINLDDKK